MAFPILTASNRWTIPKFAIFPTKGSESANSAESRRLLSKLETHSNEHSKGIHVYLQFRDAPSYRSQEYARVVSERKK
jgi:hypothetical protein